MTPAGIMALRACAVIGAASCAVFIGTLWSSELLWDDAQLCAEQPLASAPLELLETFTTPYWGRGDYLYRPLALWSLALGHALGLAGQHAVNVLLHAAVGCVLYVLLRRVGIAEWPSLAAALIFAVHPIHSEVVAQLVGRSELLAALAGSAFVVLHLRERQRLAATACLFAAMCSKESAIAFVALAAWTDACFRRLRAGPYLAYAGALAAWLALRAAAISAGSAGIPFLDNPAAHAPAWARWLTAARVQLDYAQLQVAPYNLSADYSYAQLPVVTSLAHPRVLGFVVLSALAGLAAWRLWPRERTMSWAIGGYALLFVPTANFVLPIGTIMAERLAYAPSLMATALAGQALWLARRRFGRTVTIALGLALVVLGATTVVRNRSWVDPGVFARTLVRTAPNSAKAHYTLALERSGAGDTDAAVAALRRAIEVYPDYAEAWSRLGSVQADRADYASAIDSFERAVQIHPRFTEAWYGLGHACQRAGRLDQAVEAYETVLRLDESFVSAWVNLGAIHAERGRLDEAENMWTEALRRDPDHVGARENLARSHGLRRR